MVRNPFIGSGNIIQQRGRLASYKQDLNAHSDGTGFRQDATTVDMNPQLVAFPAPTVQGTLELIETFLLNDGAFTSIGDGANSFGMFNVGDPGLPDVESCFTAALATARISFGGVILVKAGQYDFNSGTSVTLPGGVSVMGEVGGTILNAETAQPIFIVQESASDTIRTSPLWTTDGSKANWLFNLSFFDAFGSATPNLTGGNSAFVRCNRGSNLRVEQCSAFGKVATAGAPPPITRRFVTYSAAPVSTYNTRLSIENCHIAAVQQIVDFDIPTATDNKLTIRNNRFMCSGLTGAPTTNREMSAVAFQACDANLSNNQIWFGINATVPSLQTIQSCFACYSSGSSVKNLIVMGNQAHFADTTLIDDMNRLIREDNDGLENMRSVISGNTIGGASDSNTWFIVVGDGSSTIGDINGELAIQNIVKQFYYMDTSVFHGSVKIYVKPGSYTITDKTIFETPAVAGTRDGLPMALIGVSGNGNFPQITLNVTAPAANGQEMMFGHHIENIYFTGERNYYKIMVRNDLVNADSFQSVVVKNCRFDNCGVGFLTLAASAVVDEMMKNEVFIEDCQFSNDFALLNILPENTIAITGENKNGKIFISRCNTIKNDFYGRFFVFRTPLAPVDNAENCQLYIDNCVLTSLKMNGGALTDFIQATYIRTFRFTNNTVDLSSCTYTVSPVVSAVITTTSIDDYSECTIKNNNFLGNVAAIWCISGTSQNLTIEENLLTDFNVFIIVNIGNSGAPTSMQPVSFNINNNKVIAKAKTHTTIYCTNTINASVLNNVTGEFNVKNNIIDMENQGTSGLIGGAINNMYATIVADFAGNGNLSISANIEENKIIDFKAVTGGGSDYESCICIMGAETTNITDNHITYTHNNTVRDFYAIYVSPNEAGGAYTSNNQFTNVSNNYVLSTNSVLGGANELSHIFVRDTQFVKVNGNSLRYSGGVLTWFAQVYSTSPTFGNEGSVTDNMLSANLANGGIRYKNGVLHEDIKVRVARNRNQRMVKNILCTDFQPYGYPRAIENTALNDGYTGAKILWKTKNPAWITPVLDLNEDQQHIMDDGATGGGPVQSWVNLEEGLYYTNAYGDPGGSGGWSTAPNLYDGVYPGTYLISTAMHQVIIPLNIADFATISQITIPIFWSNESGGAVTVQEGANLISGNDVLSSPTRIEEIPGTASWAKRTLFMGNNTDSQLDLTIYPTNFIVFPARNSDGSSPEPTPNCYIVLAMSVASVDDEVMDLYFAIPYVQVMFTW